MVIAAGASRCVVVTGDTGIGLDGLSNGVAACKSDSVERHGELANVESEEDLFDWSARHGVWPECRPSREELVVKGTYGLYGI